MSSYKKLQVVQLTTDYAKATKIVEVPLADPKDDEVLVKNHYAGINATDINISAGRYFTDGKVPFDVGFEGLGVIQAIGCKVTGFSVGQSVLYLGNQGFSQYIYSKAEQLIPVPEVNPKYLSIPVNGLTATIGLDKAGLIRSGEKVLITAAAGGTGQMAVQWAKAKGCHVVGTASTEKKCQYLKSIGCDKVINYKETDLFQQLSADYPEGVDVIWETIGGETFTKLIDHLAIHGRIVVVGGITGYKSTGFPDVNLSGLPGKILMKSLSINGFLLLNEPQHFKEYTTTLLGLISSDKIHAKVDMGEDCSDGLFKGLEGAVRAVEWLHTGKSSGKVIVHIQ